MLVINNGADCGETVPHLHVRILTTPHGLAAGLNSRLQEILFGAK